MDLMNWWDENMIEISIDLLLTTENVKPWSFLLRKYIRWDQAFIRMASTDIQ